MIVIAKAIKILMLIENHPAPDDVCVWAEAVTLRDAGIGAMEVQDGIEYALYGLYNLVYKRNRQDVSLVLMGDER